MKKLYIGIVLSLLGCNCFGQGWEWVKPAAYNNGNYQKELFKKSPLGSLVSIYHGGYYSNQSDIIFYNSEGELLWKKSFTKLFINDFCFDNNDNIYFTGFIKDTLLLDGNTIISNGGADVILGKFNNKGDLIKYLTFGSASSEAAISLALSNNHIFVSGTYNKSFSTGNVQISETGNSEAFIIKFNIDFVATHSTQIASSLGSSSVKISIDRENFVYFIGHNTESQISIQDTIFYTGEEGEFLAKFDNDLKFLWGKVVIGSFMNGYSYPYILFDNKNNVVVINSGGGGHGGHLGEDVLEKYTSQGTRIWRKELDNINYLGGIDINTTNNNIIIGGILNFFGAYKAFSILTVAESGDISTLFYDTTITHTIKGLAIRSNYNFYILGNCSEGSYLSNYTCSPSDSRFIAHYGSAVTSIKENITSKFTLHPNPSSGKFSIQFNEPVIEGKICVYNVLGECVIPPPPFKNGESEIDLSTKPKGIYFVEMNYDDKKEVRKVVVH